MSDFQNFHISITSLQISCAYASLQSKTLLLHLRNKFLMVVERLYSKEAVTRENFCLCFYNAMVISFLDKGRWAISKFSIFLSQVFRSAACTHRCNPRLCCFICFTKFLMVVREFVSKEAVTQDKISVFAFTMQWSLAFLINGDKWFPKFPYFYHKSSDQLRVCIAAI